MYFSKIYPCHYFYICEKLFFYKTIDKYKLLSLFNFIYELYRYTIFIRYKYVSASMKMFKKYIFSITVQNEIHFLPYKKPYLQSDKI